MHTHLWLKCPSTVYALIFMAGVVAHSAAGCRKSLRIPLSAAAFVLQNVGETNKKYIS